MISTIFSLDTMNNCDTSNKVSITQIRMNPQTSTLASVELHINIDCDFNLLLKCCQPDTRGVYFEKKKIGILRYNNVKQRS